MTLEEWVVFILFTIAINLIVQIVAWKLGFWIGIKNPAKQLSKDLYNAISERPQGEWIYKEFDVESGISRSYWCSNCGEPKSQWCDDFCQRCGADMRKGGAE